MQQTQEVQISRLDDKLWQEATNRAVTLLDNDPSVCAGVILFEAGRRVPDQGFVSHDGTEVSLILEGEVVLGLQGEAERTVRGGELCVIPKGTPHYSYNPGPEDARIVWTIAPRVDL